MTIRLRDWARWVGYPAFYLGSLLLFVYVTFPFDRIKERLVAEFNARQTDGSRLEIDDMSWYWGSGVEASGVRLTLPPPKSASVDQSGAVPKPRVIELEHVYARLSILSFLFGTRHVSFGAGVLGGEVSGEVTDQGNEREVALQFEEMDVGALPFMRDVSGLPMTGTLTGSVELTAPEQKLAKSRGKVSLKLSRLTVGDGKAKVMDALALPKLDAGDLTLEADIAGGRVDLKQFSARGPDVEVIADGKVRLRDPFNNSLAELGLRFRFSDKYKSKNETTKSLFGAPGSNMPALFDMDPKAKRAKRPDGFYSWRVTGPFEHLLFEPSPAGVGGAGSRARGTMRGFPGTQNPDDAE